VQEGKEELGAEAHTVAVEECTASREEAALADLESTSKAGEQETLGCAVVSAGQLRNRMEEAK